jgi:hypothetical protein
VAAAVLDGRVGTGSFNPRRVLEPTRQRLLRDKVVVNCAPELGTLAGGKLKRAQAGYLSRVEIEHDGEIVHGAAALSPGILTSHSPTRTSRQSWPRMSSRSLAPARTEKLGALRFRSNRRRGPPTDRTARAYGSSGIDPTITNRSPRA